MIAIDVTKLNTYQTISAPAQFNYQEKHSQFMAFIYPIANKEAMQDHLQALKTKYPDARHYCWAYLIGDPQQPVTAGFNDDGEPSGTAGKPILHVLTQRGAGNTCAIVVRYFGGIKLGAGGLVRAYGQAVSKALDTAVWQAVVPMSSVVIETTYEDEPHIRHFVEVYTGKVVDQQYGSKVTLDVVIATADAPQFEHSISQKTAGRSILSR